MSDDLLIIDLVLFAVLAWLLGLVAKLAMVMVALA